MNQLIIDARVQSDAKVFDEVLCFNISALTGVFQFPDNTRKNRYTYIRVIYDGEDIDKAKELLKIHNQIRIYGKLDSEQYEAASGKRVYNKVIRAHDIRQLKFNYEKMELEEVQDA